MVELVNILPFPNFRFYSQDAERREFGVIVVKGTFEIVDDAQLVVAEEQAPMAFTDKCHGEVNVSSLWHPSDIVPHKPTADIIVNAVARAPGGDPTRSWECGIKVEGPEGTLVAKRLQVTGQRWWVPRWKVDLREEHKREWQKHRKYFSRWELSEPEPATHVPLRYELAFGGTWTRGEDEDGAPIWDCDGRNPIGRGWLDEHWTDHTIRQPAPQIELAGSPITEPYARSVPQTLGPIPPAWDPRLRKSGTYDDHWQDHVWPNWPADYDFAYHNSAHPDLICPRFLRPGDSVTLMNLCRHKSTIRFSIPQLTPIVQFLRRNGTVERADFNLDTCFIDLGDDDPAESRAILSWRITYQPDAFMTAILCVAPGREAGLADMQLGAYDG